MGSRQKEIKNILGQKGFSDIELGSCIESKKKWEEKKTVHEIQSHLTILKSEITTLKAKQLSLKTLILIIFGTICLILVVMLGVGYSVKKLYKSKPTEDPEGSVEVLY